MNNSKKRVEYFDILRGIAIIAVIAIHCTLASNFGVLHNKEEIATFAAEQKQVKYVQLQ